MALVLICIYIWNTGKHHDSTVALSFAPSWKLALSLVLTKANLALILAGFILKFEVRRKLAARRPPGWFRLWQIIFCDSTLWCAGVSPTLPSHLLGHPREWGLSYLVSFALRQGQTVETFFFSPLLHPGSPPAAAWYFNVCFRWYYRVQRSLVIDAIHLIPHAVLQSGWRPVVALNTSLITALSVEVMHQVVVLPYDTAQVYHSDILFNLRCRVDHTFFCLFLSHWMNEFHEWRMFLNY